MSHCSILLTTTERERELILESGVQRKESLVGNKYQEVSIVTVETKGKRGALLLGDDCHLLEKIKTKRYQTFKCTAISPHCYI